MTQTQRQLALLLLMINWTFGTQAQEDLKRQKITKEISMEVPVDFVNMSPDQRTNKYISSRVPIAMFTSIDNQIDLGVNENSSAWAGDDLEILMSFYKASIVNLFTEVKFIQEDIQSIAGRDFIVFEFVSKVTDEESTFGGTTSISKYTYIQYTLRNDRVLLFNFTCPSRMRPQWQDAAKTMMESIRIKS